MAYSIGRVMEFLPAEKDAKGKGTRDATFTRARIAWYYRPGDLRDKPNNDSRLLLAAIYSEVHPLSYIRGKCFVRHKDMIPDLTAWRKAPDSFYFFRFFDPYIKKEYEVLRSRDINNRKFITACILPLSNTKNICSPATHKVCSNLPLRIRGLRAGGRARSHRPFSNV